MGYQNAQLFNALNDKNTFSPEEVNTYSRLMTSRFLQDPPGRAFRTVNRVETQPG
jgi:hypothetical protein